MVNSLYFPALSTLSLPAGTQLWRIATKTDNNFNKFLTADFIFRYSENTSEFDLEGSYMTIFHQGTDSASNGFSVVLYKPSGSTDIQIGVRYRAGSGTSWTDLAGSFVSLNSIGDVSVDGYQFMFQYDYNGTNKIVNFYVAQFNGTTTKTTPDFSFETTTGPSVGTTSLNQWGFGALPQALNENTTGYNNVNDYNGYVAQNLQVLFLRTWSTLLPKVATGTNYGMFNSDNSAYSLYELNKSETYVPAGVTNLPFQLMVPDDSTNIADLDNNAVDPAVDVTLATSTTNFQTLTSFAVNSSTGYIFIDTSEIPCVLIGTKVLCENGYRNIEDIKIGDKVRTHDGRLVEVLNILNIRVSNQQNTQCIKIEKGSYNQFSIIDDLYISKTHAILLEDEFVLGIHNKTIPYKLIDRNEKSWFHYFCLETPNHLTDTFIANGLPIETWSGCFPWNKQTQYVGKLKYNEKGNRILETKKD
jgi:hypothetical protein